MGTVQTPLMHVVVGSHHVGSGHAPLGPTRQRPPEHASPVAKPAAWQSGSVVQGASRPFGSDAHALESAQRPSRVQYWLVLHDTSGCPAPSQHCQ
jgi:hypothetical protein